MYQGIREIGQELCNRLGVALLDFQAKDGRFVQDGANPSKRS